ncbi:MAG: M28 family peptidase [Saprospiraceae bacterium]|nr:M28 family peptidase [Saprospiraceae bacterium]
MSAKILRPIQGVILLLALCLVGCKSEPGSATAFEERSEVVVPPFNRDSALQYVRQQVSFGPRYVGSEGHTVALEWMAAKLESSGAALVRQDFVANLYTGEDLPATNLIASYNSEHKRRIVLAAHWDTRHIAEKDPDPGLRDDPILGADDGASGTAVLLEIARVLGSHQIDLGVDLVFFDAEDYGENGGADDTWCLGSQHWARNLKGVTRPQYGVLLDMVGSKGAVFRKEGVSLHFARQVVDKVWSLAQSMGYGHYFSDESLQPITDDHLFVNQISGIPMIDIIYQTSQGSFGAYHHTHADDLSIIDKNTMGAVGQVMVALLFHESAGSL